MLLKIRSDHRSHRFAPLTLISTRIKIELSICYLLVFCINRIQIAFNSPPLWLLYT